MIQKYTLDIQGSDDIMLSMFHSETVQDSGDAKSTCSRNVNPIYKKNYIDKAAIVQSLFYDILDRALAEESESDEDEFEFEGFEYDNQSILYSNVEFKIWKINERERKKQNLTKNSKTDAAKGENKLSSKFLGAIQESKNRFTQNTTNSSTSGSSKAIGMRSKLNLNSQAYNINQPRSRAINNSNVQNFRSTNQILYPLQNMIFRDQKMINDHSVNYHQIYNQSSNHGMMNPMNVRFQHDMYRVETSKYPK